MRIIGGRDYYDGVVPFDTDRERVFLRAKREVRLPLTTASFAVDQYLDRRWKHELRKVEVIFCGKRHRGMELVRERYNVLGLREAPIYLWSAAKLSEYVLFRPRSERRRSHRDDWIYAEDLEKFFTPEPITGPLFDQLINDKILIAIAPIVGVRGRDDTPWMVNGVGLNKIGFGSAVPPWEAYQELDMFIGTILVGDESRMVTVSDQTKRDKYGFDRWSFRNAVHPAKPRGRTAA